jgi:hypothetical protein
LVSTLKALFESRKELFKGLWIESSDWPWQPHPVVQVDFSQIDLTNATAFEQSLIIALDQIAAAHGLHLKNNLLINKFVELITELHKKYQEKLVLLVDEYDKPIITHLGHGESGLQTARQNQVILKKFFGTLKGADISARLRLVFITGISKFSKVSLFSDLNNLQDLSMRESYAGLLGYTQEELENYFSKRIEEFARRRQTAPEEILQLLRNWYNGHRFTKAELLVYNPFSILNAVSEYDFKNYWFETGTPSFLVNLIKERDYPIPNIENLQVREATFSTFDLDNLKLEALLFQTGYTTIQGFDGLTYRLGYPNQEVKNSFLSYLYDNLVKIADTNLKEQFIRLHQYLAQDDIEQFMQTTNAILSAIPYPQIEGRDEGFYHTVFYLMLSASGVLVHTEPLTSHGRIDMAVEFKDRVFILELKCNQSAAAAIRQIHDKRYYDKYAQSGRKIYLLGINFSTKERAIVDWQMEALK